MSLTKHSIETLLDLVEIRLSAMLVCDREDARELATLENCRRELGGLTSPKRRAQAIGQPMKESKQRKSRPYLAALMTAGV